MSEQVAPAGQGWGIRASRAELAPQPVTEVAESATAAMPAPAYAFPPPAPAPVVDGTWVAGVGWVASTHPYATGAVKPPRPRPRRKGVLAFGPSSVAGRIALRLGISASLGAVLFSAFGRHSWITDLFHGSHDVVTPASIGGDPLVVSGPLAQLSKQVDAYFATSPIVEKSAGGFYAVPDANSPAYAAYGIKHRGASMTAGEMSDVVDHIAGGAYAGTHTQTTDGVTYTCGNVAYEGRVGVACVWDDYDVAGFLVSFADTDVDGVMALTRMARNAIEGTTSAPSSSSSSS